MPLTTKGLCLDCNYPLRELIEPRCPECGRPFDPADPSTINFGSPITSATLWLLGPVRWYTRAIMLIAAAITLWLARLPGAELKVVTIGKWIWTAVLALWLLTPIVRYIARRKYKWRRDQLHLGHRRWGGIVALTALVLTLHFKLPMKASLQVSKPSMTRLARTIMDDPNPSYKNTWVGLYPAKNLRKIPGGMKFTVEDSDVTYKAGFVYFPTVNPRHASWHQYRYVGDGWWAWREEG